MFFIKLTQKSFLGLLACIFCTLYLFIVFNSKELKNKQITVTEELKTKKILVNLYDVLEVCINAAEMGGEQLMAVKDLPVVELKDLKKGIYSPNIKSHCAMLSTIHQDHSKIQITSKVGEFECDNDDKKVPTNYRRFHAATKIYKYENVDDVLIWMQPLDAFEEYKQKMYDFVTTMICVAVRGQPVIGIIHSPFSKTTTWAWVNEIASSDLVSQMNKGKYVHTNQKILVSANSEKLDYVLLDALEDFELYVAPGSGYKFLQLVMGRADVYLEMATLSKWDTCAGNAILDAIGGKITTKDGTPINYTLTETVELEKGLIATVLDHSYFVDKLINYIRLY